MCRHANLLVWVFCIFVMLFANPVNAQTSGTMRYNSTAKKMEFFDGSQWFNFGISIGVGACTKAGAMDYDTLLGSYKYCNGATWVSIAVVPISLYFCIGTRPGTINYDSVRKSFLMCNGLAWTNMKGLLASS